MRMFRFLLVVVASFTVIGSGHAAETAGKLTAEQVKFFESKIRPILVSECYGCHSKQSGQARGGLKLDTRGAMALGGDSGPAIVPGSLEDSLLFGALNHDDFIMPPKRKLSAAVIADFRKWILDGAPDPRVEKAIASPTQTIDEETIREAKETFWAYQPPTRTAPSDAGSDWAKTDVDRYVFDGLQDAGLTPTDDADAGRLLRRLCFDLVGLPPTPQQVTWFRGAYKTDADAAVAHVVDQLLDKPQFGEHWGRHWLDTVRYAESTGREVNMTYPNAWRYRDYVIDAFNDDKPYDQFVQEQLAGDLLPAKDDNEWTDHLIATGFLAIGTKNVNEQSGAQFAADVADEQIDATTRVFLGTSVACARCHDHKFDPIRQTDYYAMAGIFRSTKTFFGSPPSEFGSPSMPQLRRPSSLILLPVPDPNPYDKSYSKAEMDEMRDQLEELRGQLAGMRRGGNDAANAQRMRIRLTNQMSEISNKLGVVDESGQPRSYCMGVQDQKSVGDTRLLVRGEIDQPGSSIDRNVPIVLSDNPLSIKSGRSGRLELARWIGSDENTLAARVMVNRVWSHVFGQGIVTTTEDFGMTGTYPSHPELLDHLTLEFIESGWSVKSLVRSLIQSRAYRMDSTFDVASHEQDPDNRLLWRSNVKRLPAESIRDAMLSISDSLETDRPRGSMVAKAGYTRVRGEQLGDPREQIRRTIEQAFVSRREQARDRFRQQQQARRGGNFFRGRSQSDRQEMVRMTQQVMQDASLDSVNSNKRSVYLPIVRDFVPRSLEVFDFADPSMVIGVREASNTPNQALFMMNNPLTLRLSDSFAERILESEPRLSDRVQRAFVLAYGREPSAQERKASMRYLSDSGMSPKQAFSAFCQSLFAAAEFRYLN
ncbi:MAG: PSD1 and planctomycete cytochrome C domain-containing protein [Planctomycetota bacterium]